MKLSGYENCESWLVTAGCTLIVSLSLTPYRLSGLMYVTIIDYYGTDRKTASVPIMLFLLIKCLGGPLFGLLGNKFGLEELTAIGCVLTAVGFGACFFAQDIIAVIFFLGVTYGIGVALSNIYIPSIIKKHFTKHFNTANGITYAGSCLGAVLVPPMALYLEDIYGTAGSFLILSGIMLNALPIAIYVLATGKLRNKTKLLQFRSKNKFSDKRNIASENKLIIDIEKLIDKSLNEQQQVPLSYSVHNLESEKGKAELCQEEYFINNLLSNNPLPKVITKNNDTDASDFQKLSENERVTKTPVMIVQKCSVSSLPQMESSSDVKKSKFYSLSIYKDPSFLIILLNVALGTYVAVLVWTTMLDYSRDKGISRDLEIYFLMLQPFADMIGRACFGWVTDLGYLSLSSYGILCYGQMAVALFLVIWTNKFGIMMAGAIWCALACGAINSVYPGIIYKCIDKEHQIMAISSRHSLFGALIFTSSPLIGYFREVGGSYDGLYWLLIALCIVCALSIPFMFKFSKSANTL